MGLLERSRSLRRVGRMVVLTVVAGLVATTGPALGASTAAGTPVRLQVPDGTVPNQVLAGQGATASWESNAWGVTIDPPGLTPKGCYSQMSGAQSETILITSPGGCYLLTIPPGCNIGLACPVPGLAYSFYEDPSLEIARLTMKATTTTGDHTPIDLQVDWQGLRAYTVSPELVCGTQGSNPQNAEIQTWASAGGQSGDKLIVGDNQLDPLPQSDPYKATLFEGWYGDSCTR